MLKYTYLILLILFVSCNNSSIKKPKNLISVEEMAAILTDIHHLETKVANLNATNTDTANFVYRTLEQKIFVKHAVDTASYKQSYKYYLVNPEEFTAIYKVVVKNLEKEHKKDSILQLKEAKLVKPDTFRLKNLKNQAIQGKMLMKLNRIRDSVSRNK
jgi:hypothetical protein